MGLLFGDDGDGEGPLAFLRWRRLPWAYRLLYLLTLALALRRAWDACDDAVARSWSALLFDEEEEAREAVLGGSGKGGVGRLARRCAFGACSLVHGPLLALWERCLAASEAKEITLPSILLALVGLVLQLLVLASNLIDAYLLRWEGMAALAGMLILQHKEAAYAWCDEMGLTALLGWLWPPLGPAMDWLAGCLGLAGDGLLGLLEEVNEAELPELEDMAPPPPPPAARQQHPLHPQQHTPARGGGNGLRRRRGARRGSGNGGVEPLLPLSPGVVTRSSSRKMMNGSAGVGVGARRDTIEAEELLQEEGDGEEQPLLYQQQQQQQQQQQMNGHSGSHSGGGDRRKQQPPPPPALAAAAPPPAAASASKRARPPPEGWLVYDEAAGLVPYEVAARWSSSSSSSSAAAPSNANGHALNGYHHHHDQQQQPPEAAGRRVRGGGGGGDQRASPPPVRTFGGEHR